MTKKKLRGLGRNRLDVLLSQPVSMENAVVVAEQAGGELRELLLTQIEPGRFQPRRYFDEDALQELADSIKSQGIIQPIIVRETAPDHFEIVAGERRWRAAKLASLEKIPALVKDIPDATAVAMALIENIQRQDLNPIEEAEALDRLQVEFSMTQLEVAEAVGKSRSQVTNYLRLLTLAPNAKEMLIKGTIEMGHAKVLLGLETSMQAQAAKIVALRGMTVRETENLVKRTLVGGEVEKAPKVPLHPELQSIEKGFADRLGAKVQIKAKENGKGKLIIHYQSTADLEDMLYKIQ